MKRLLFIFIFLLHACTPSPTLIYDHTGQQAFMADCSGAAYTWSRCQEIAGKQCGAAGYTILSQSDSSGSMGYVTGQLAFASNIANRNMMFRCNNAGQAGYTTTTQAYANEPAVHVTDKDILAYAMAKAMMLPLKEARAALDDIAANGVNSDFAMSARYDYIVYPGRVVAITEKGTDAAKMLQCSAMLDAHPKFANKTTTTPAGTFLKASQELINPDVAKFLYQELKNNYAEIQPDALWKQSGGMCTAIEQKYFSR